jgi:hypothetical protein
MKKNYFIAVLALVVNFVSAQIEPTSYVGAFSPTGAMWTDSWTNWDPQNTAYTDAATVVNVTTNITANTTWTTGKTYKLTGLIYVTNNATLTIQAGVVVKGVYTSTGTALVITKGAKLNAIGTATSPIVFTSAKAVGQRAAGDWGGVILLGKASFNLNNGINNIEGITASVNTEYGGGLTPDDNDNSGTMKYCRIEFPGFVFSPNNEINGLTFGAVGRGTTIDYVQVSFSGDDSFEWFGGTVNNKHIVAYRGLDDDFDTDNGYSGVSQFCLGVRDPQISDNPAISTSEGFESDNNAGGTLVSPYTACIFSNCTLIGPKYRVTLPNGGTLAGGYKRAARLRRASKQKIYNSIFLDFKEGLHVDGAAAETNALNDELKWKNNIIAGAATTPFLQVNSPGTITVGNNASFNMTTWYNANGNQSLTSNAGILVAPYDTTNAQNYAGLDYRPGTGSPALNAASFTDAAIAAVTVAPVGSTPIVANLTYCKGTIAAQLTATLTTTGVSLLWYTAATGGVGSATAPTPATTVVGTKTYYVSQIDGSAIESARVPLTVTVNALPTEVISAITGVAPVGFTSAVAVGPNVGTTNQYTYSVTPFVDTTLSYLWTVPNGANIVSGQGTNSIVVNYLNVPAGAGAAGNIAIQAVNTSGCATAAKKLAITKALPAAPASVKMYNRASATPATAVTVFGAYMGSYTPITLVAGTVAAATSYVWSLPSGVNVVIPTTGVTTTSTTLWYTAYPFDAPQTTEPSPSVGTKYFKVIYTANTFDIDGVSTVVTTSVASQIIKNGGLYGANTTQVYPIYGTAGTLVSTNRPTIVVNFAGVTSASTNLLYLGARSKNAVGYSVTSNAAAALANPTVASLFTNTYTETYVAPVAPSTPATSSFAVTATAATTAKLLKITSALPAAVKTVTGQTTLICSSTTVTYTMVAAVQASSYSITAPAGSVVTSASNTTNTTNTLTTSDLSFDVAYPAAFASVTPKTLTITTSNAVGASIAAPKVITLTAGACKSKMDDAAVIVRNTVSIYPNPASSEFNVEVNAVNDSVMTMSIYTVEGAVVSTRNLSVTEGVTNVNENISELANGIYFVQFVNQTTNETIVKKLIKR